MTYALATALVPVEINRSAVADISGALTAADTTNGNKFTNDPGRTVLRAKNATASPVVITVDTPATVEGLAVADRTYSVPATTGDVLIGPFPAFYHQPGSQDVYLTTPGAVTLKAYHLNTD